MATALYPGAFKPPHRGHFNVVKNLLKGTHSGKLYTPGDIEKSGQAALSGESDEVEPIDKVVVFIGAKDRNGISTKESLAIWEIYKKYLGNVEFYYEAANPMQNASAYAKKRPSEKFYAITGIRGEEDMIDLRRISSFKNRENTQGLIISAPGGTRATDLRSAVLSGNLDNIRDFFPEELKREEILKIVNILKESIISEIMAEKVDDLFDVWFKEEINEGSSGAPIAPRSVVKSEDREKLIRVYERLRELLGDEFYHISFQDDHVRVTLKGKVDRHNFDYTPYMASILEYMIDQGMNITPLPEVKIKKDLVEASDFFGRTAYYDPNVKEVVLYTQGRHPKDVMRSFTHEMIHHIQNLEGRLSEVSTSDTNADDNLLELEKEAYLKGNITFRNWEDGVKNMKEGLWANINAKKKAGKKPSHGNSKAHKAAVKAGNKLEKSK